MAVLTENDPKSCILLFDSYHDSKLQNEIPSLDNSCFVCGVQGTADNQVHIAKFSILKHEYWKHLKDEDIQNLSLIGNMIPLCLNSERNCISKAHKWSWKYTHTLCLEYPNITRHPSLFTENNPFHRARSAASALRKSEKSIPLERKKELIKKITEYFGLQFDSKVDEITDESVRCEDYLTITGIVRERVDSISTAMGKIFYSADWSSKEIYKRCCDLLMREPKEWQIAHSKEMAQMFEGREREFVNMWRRNFVDTMNPLFVPSYWPLSEMVRAVQ